MQRLLQASLSQVLAVVYNGYPIVNSARIDENSFNEPFADSSLNNLVLDMHGLIFTIRV